MFVDLTLYKKGNISMLTSLEVVTDIAAEEARHFTVLDAMKLYYQYLLYVKSHTPTTFIMPSGHFKYLRAPYCLLSITGHCNHCVAEVFEGLSIRVHKSSR